MIAFAAVVAAAGVLAGCRAEEQGRPLILKKGVYNGTPDAALSEAQLNKLKDRVALQGGSASGAAGPALNERPTVEKPAPVSKGLNERLRMQVGPPDVPRKTEADKPKTNAAAAAPAPAAPAAAAPKPAAMPAAPPPSVSKPAAAPAAAPATVPPPAAKPAATPAAAPVAAPAAAPAAAPSAGAAAGTAAPAKTPADTTATPPAPNNPPKN